MALRMAWLVLIGWWFSAIWVAIAWLALLLGFTESAGMQMLVELPRLVRLRAPDDRRRDIVDDTLFRLEESLLIQRPLVLRLLYVVAVGWWLSIIWAVVAWLGSLSLQTRPAPLTMFMRLPAVMTLRRY